MPSSRAASCSACPRGKADSSGFQWGSGDESLVEWESVLHEAAERVQEVRDRLVSVQEGTERLGEGAGGDVTMRVDQEAEDEIIEVVRQKGDVRLVAEEHGESGPKDARWTVIIDPIDGSSNFERRNPVLLHLDSGPGRQDPATTRATPWSGTLSTATRTTPRPAATRRRTVPRSGRAALRSCARRLWASTSRGPPFLSSGP